MDKPALRRCAVYTRKSSEEGLDQAFNSLDAQREACSAYIASQVGEGWKPVRALYDDGGLSGGTLERPALQTLLQDIRDRRIDTVVVYKVDRLTRSLSDFARIVDVFDSHGVSFVSVTQQFNTTTSMGRLTLNMLLSFAQFEREVTGERIRDKIAASKQKGMWMGGHVPLGYEADGRTLTINEAEATTIRTLFDLYLELGNVREVRTAAGRLGLATKHRQLTDGTATGGRPLSRGHIYRILSNPLYIGKIAHKGLVHDGLHPAIIDMETWESVRAKLATQAPRRSASRAAAPSPLVGKLYDETGIALTPSHAVKNGRRYRYYVSRHLVTGQADGSPATPNKGWRLPAGEIEKTLLQALCSLLHDATALANAARASGIEAGSIGTLLAAVPADPGLAMLERVELTETQLTLTVNCADLLEGAAPAIRHVTPMAIRRRGVEMRLVLAGAGDTRTGKPDPILIRAISRAQAWYEGLTDGRHGSIGAIAADEGVSDRYISQLLPLAFLAPAVIDAILAVPPSSPRTCRSTSGTPRSARNA